MEIGFIGLGIMGRAMAKNLVAAGHTVKAWNRSGVDIDGVTRVDSAAEAFQSDAVLTMLSDDAAIREVVLDSGLLDSGALDSDRRDQARPNTVHIVASTISVAFAHELVERHRQANIDYVSAPVLGRPDVAAAGELQILAGGEPAAIDRVRPIFEAIGKRVWEMGAQAPAANAAKIACNMMITMAIESMAEAVVLTEANGVERARFFELILGTLFGSRAYQVYSANIAEGDYEPGFKATLGLKDLRLAREAGEQAGGSLPMLDAVHQRLAETIEAGFGDRDWSAMADFTIRAKG